MIARWLTGGLCLAVAATAAWLSGSGDGKKPAAWQQVAPGVWRSSGLPAGYALVDGDSALLIDAPTAGETLQAHGVKKIDLVLLTHHHRDSCAAAGTLLTAKVKVRAPKASAEWLTPEGVRKYWQESLPLRGSRTAYLVVPTGLEGIDCSLVDGETITWHGWNVQVVSTPGHSRDHVSFVARKGQGSPVLVFCGDALAAPGKMWTPYTTDWDHWTDQGLKPAAASLRKLAEMRPDLLLPAHGDVISKDAVGALTKTAAVVEEAGFLKSFERYTKQRLGNQPMYRFLAKEQATSNGSKPWTRVAEHLWLTGNTYVLVSKENACLVVDPWDKLAADQIAKLRAAEKLGPIEVVMFSHAHFDHYDGVYHLPQRDQFEVWTLDLVAPPIEEPFKLRAPFVDARPVRVDRKPKAGDVLAWREYRFRFHHLPGQTEYTMGVETSIDGKSCYFTADNFFHQDMFSGSGGWMGLNRSFPLLYAASAQKVLDAAPEWVLAEHGGPFEFHAEDFKRRVQWGKECAKAVDALSPSGNHLKDWNPHRVSVLPFGQKAKAGATLKWNLVIHNPLPAKENLEVVLQGRGVFADQTWMVEVPGGKTVTREFSFQVPAKMTAGRHVFALKATEGAAVDGADTILVVDVE
jgi:glyoxylase-like metal-dependent hydrolase (beta-lactamase superfamily II)